MTVLHIIAAMDPSQGGVSQAVLSMITGLKEQGIESEVVSLDAPEAPFLTNFLRIASIHAMGPGKSSWCYNSGLYRWLCSHLHRFDVVISHGLWLYPGYAVIKALRRISKNGKKTPCLPKFFVMPHGMLDPYFQHTASRRLKAWRNQLYWKLIEGKIINGANALLFTCEEERRLASSTFSPYHPHLEKVVGLGVEEPPLFSVAMKEAFVQKCPASFSTPYLLFLSRIHEKKGIDLLLGAYDALVKRIRVESGQCAKQPFPKLIIAGPGLETDYGRQVQQIVVSSPVLAENVLFTGMLTGNAKWGAFYGCEAFILPSYQENFGIAVVEALACQKLVLISDQVNIWREIETANCGIITSVDLKGVEQLLKMWFEMSKEKKLLMGENARKLFQKSFAVEAAAKQLAAALQ